ncbi:hypothetical protein H5T87_06955 [bacterium]|nr:hypothetical protein [bacterium]
MSEEGIPKTEEFPDKAYPGFLEVFKKSWWIYRENGFILLKAFFSPLLSVLVFAYLVYSIQKTNFQYSIWFTLFQFFFPLGISYIFMQAILGLFQESDVSEEMSLILSLITKKRSTLWFFSSETACYPLICFFFFLSTPIAFSSLFWVIFLLLTIGRDLLGINLSRRGSKKIREELLDFAVALAFAVLHVIPLVLPALIAFVVDRGRLSIYIFLFTNFIFLLFLTPFMFVHLLVANKIRYDFSLREPIGQKRAAKVGKFLVTVFLCFLLFFSFIRIWGERDIPPVNDSDLRLTIVEIPQEQNAYYDFQEAINRMRIDVSQEKLSDMIRGRASLKEIQNLLRQNEEIFPLIDKGLKLPYFQSPNLADPTQVDLNVNCPEYDKLRDLARLCVVKARFLLSQKKEKLAFDWLFNIVKMGQMLEDSPRPILITYLAGEAIKEIGVSAMRDFIPKSSLPSDILKEYAKQLLEFKESVAGLKRAGKMEYLAFVNSLTQLEKGLGDELILKGRERRWDENMGFLARGREIKWFYKPNKVRKILADRYRGLMFNADKLYKDINLPRWHKEWKRIELQKGLSSVLGENFIGRIMLELHIYPVQQVFVHKCDIDFSISSTACLFALKAYKSDKGELPDRLSELYPGYLPKIPIDPFDGKPLRYSKEKRIIYSVGKDLEDSGGSIGEKGYWFEWKDPTFRIEF